MLRLINLVHAALSIIDPVTINVEIGDRGGTCGGARPGSASRGLADAADDEPVERTAEIQLQQLNIRLSYHDWLMFSAILDSFPRQAREAFYGRGGEKPPGGGPPGEPTNIQGQISQLEALGNTCSKM